MPDDVEPTGVSADLAALVGRVAPSAATDTRLPISGLTLNASRGELTAGAFNGYLLSWSTISWDGGDFWANPLARRLYEATKAMGEKVSIGVDNVLAVSDGERYAAMLVHDVPGADFSKAITAPLWDGNGHVDADREDLKRAVAAVRRVLGAVSTVHVSFEDGEVIVRADAGDLGDGTAGVAAHLDGEARTIAISGEYLTAALDGLDHEVVRVHFGPNINRPVQVTGLHDGAPDFGTRHIIQPIKTR
jgi:DNA polymerase III sliding clamp (beta) subunit (PCNA family)